MFKPELSIVIPSIRPDRLEKLYLSACQSMRKTSFEFIVVGPFPLPGGLNNVINIKYIKDFGSPVRASCIGALVAEGEYFTWQADDAWYTPDSMDLIMDEMRSLSPCEGDLMSPAVVAKYIEGGHKLTAEQMKLSVSYPRSPHIPDDWTIFNNATMKTKDYLYMGGWDAEHFEACPVAHADLAVRCQRRGMRVKEVDIVMSECTHMPGTSGDHGPIHYAHLLNDEPAYKKLYIEAGAAAAKYRDMIPLDNWKKAPAVWPRRFKI